MANNDPQHEASGGQAESTEPANTAANTSALRKSQTESRKASMASTNANAPQLRKQSSNGHVQAYSPSPASSPRTSRNASPSRKDSRPQPLSNPPSTQPSAAAIQRALSAASTPQLQPGAATDGVSKLSTAPKSAGASGNNTPHWPTSPRLKSPPPSANNSRRGSTTGQKKAESGATPTINVQNTASQTSTPPPVKQGVDEALKSPPPPPQTPAKALASRGVSGKSTLETVQENSADDLKEPSPAAVKAAADLKPLTKLSDDDNQPPKRENVPAEGEKTTQQAESGSESAGTKSPKKRDQNSQTQRTRSSRSYPPLVPTKSRQGEGKQNMTVETETVSSIPQSALNVGDRSATGRSENSASVKQKPSSETIRPKKERKKTSQKPRSINQGTGMSSVFKSPLLTSQEYFTQPPNGDGSGSSRSSSTAREVSSSGVDSPCLPKRQYSYSQRLRRVLSLPRPTRYIRSLSNRSVRKASSKADIFEQRVANAVDEANSSESDETFVYESNPPEPRRARHHSRTPSVTSSHSVADQQRNSIRNFGDVLDDRRVAGKRSMKFSNNAFNDLDSPESKDGSVRSHQPRHFGRFGRGGSQQSMFDPDSPFTQASKLRSSQLNARNSRPNSPRNQNSAQQQQRSSALFGRKQEPSYDFDAEVGDDERTPLIGTVRTPRSARINRRINRSPSIDEYFGVRRRGRCGRLGGCVLAFIVLAVVILSTITFLVMSNRPLYDVKICRIENVLASEQELMLDLLVKAVNPNALGITVADMDINIFARSKHVNPNDLMLATSESPLRRRSRRRTAARQTPALNTPNPWAHHSSRSPSPLGNVDEGTDPPDDLDDEEQMMLLGRIAHFDTPLVFEGSPLKRHSHCSVGELRLAQPGNKTETGGSARWKKVLEHPFTLITRGSLKYNLPISNRLQTVAVDAAIVVHPEDPEEGAEGVRLGIEGWEGRVWGDYLEDEEVERDERRVVELDEE